MHSSKIQCLHVYGQDSLKRAGLLIRQTNFWSTLCCVLVCCAVLCCVGDVLEDLFGSAIWAIWQGEREIRPLRLREKPTFDMEREARFVCLRFFPSLLVFSHLFSLLPASSGRAGGPAGRLFTFLPVSSLFFASLLASPRLCGRAGGTTFDVSSRLFSFFRLCTIWSRWIYISFCKCIMFIRNTKLLLLLLGWYVLLKTVISKT